MCLGIFLKLTFLSDNSSQWYLNQNNVLLNNICILVMRTEEKNVFNAFKKINNFDFLYAECNFLFLFLYLKVALIYCIKSEYFIWSECTVVTSYSAKRSSWVSLTAKRPRVRRKFTRLPCDDTQSSEYTRTHLLQNKWHSSDTQTQLYLRHQLCDDVKSVVKNHP